MLNPVVLPLPTALAILAALAVAALAYQRWLNNSLFQPGAPKPRPLPPQPKPKPSSFALMAKPLRPKPRPLPVPAPMPPGRHRLEDFTDPFRPQDWTALRVERRPAAPLAMFAGAAGLSEVDTREMATIR